LIFDCEDKLNLGRIKVHATTVSRSVYFAVFFAALRLRVRTTMRKKSFHAKTRSRKDTQSQTETFSVRSPAVGEGNFTVQTPFTLTSCLARLALPDGRASDAAKFPLHLTDSPAKRYHVRP